MKTEACTACHADSILEPFEYFCQMSSISILIISSYTVSKSVNFCWHTLYYTQWELSGGWGVQPPIIFWPPLQLSFLFCTMEV